MLLIEIVTQNLNIEGKPTQVSLRVTQCSRKAKTYSWYPRHWWAKVTGYIQGFCADRDLVETVVCEHLLLCGTG